MGIEKMKTNTSTELNQFSCERNKTFQIIDENHTLANALRFILSNSAHVEFAAYSIPHPTENTVNMRIHTSGPITAAEAMCESLCELKKMCIHIKNVFQAKTSL